MTSSTAPEIPPNSDQTAQNHSNRLWTPRFIGLVTGVGVSLAVYLMGSYVVTQFLPLHYLAVITLLVLPLLLIRTWRAKELNISSDWQALSSIANSRALKLISVALTIVPLAVSVSQAAEKQYLLPFDIYLYWVSGISFFAFIVLYKISAPTVYKYSSYRDLIDREGSVRVLRESVAELQELERNHKAPFSPEREALVPASDVAAIKIMDALHPQHQEQVYHLVREYGKYLKAGYRRSLSVLLVAPIYFLVTIILTKMVLVGIEASHTADCYEGWFRGAYWQMLKKNPNIITAEELKYNQQCLRDLAAGDVKLSRH